MNYSTLDSEHNQRNLRIYLRNQQTCTFNNHNLSKGGLINNPIFVDGSS